MRGENYSAARGRSPPKRHTASELTRPHHHHRHDHFPHQFHLEPLPPTASSSSGEAIVGLPRLAPPASLRFRPISNQDESPRPGEQEHDEDGDGDGGDKLAPLWHQLNRTSAVATDSTRAPRRRPDCSPREDFLVQAFDSSALKLEPGNSDSSNNNNNNNNNNGECDGGTSLHLLQHALDASQRRSFHGLRRNSASSDSPEGTNDDDDDDAQDAQRHESAAVARLRMARPDLFPGEIAGSSHRSDNNQDEDGERLPSDPAASHRVRLITTPVPPPIATHRPNIALASPMCTPMTTPVAAHGHGGPPTRWLRDEDEKLREAVARFGGKNWKQIAEALGNGRSDVQCLHRWNKVLKPGLIKGPWTPEEDRVLSALIARHGVGKIRWCDVALHLPGRIGKQCRERWCNHLDSRIRKGQWTPEEDDVVFRWQQTLGNKWSEIAKLLPGRTENAVKNRFNSAARRKWMTMMAAHQQSHPHHQQQPTPSSRSQPPHHSLPYRVPGRLDLDSSSLGAPRPHFFDSSASARPGFGRPTPSLQALRPPPNSPPSLFVPPGSAPDHAPPPVDFAATSDLPIGLTLPATTFAPAPTAFTSRLTDASAVFPLSAPACRPGDLAEDAALPPLVLPAFPHMPSLPPAHEDQANRTHFSLFPDAASEARADADGPRSDLSGSSTRSPHATTSPPSNHHPNPLVFHQPAGNVAGPEVAMDDENMTRFLDSVALDIDDIME